MEISLVLNLLPLFLYVGSYLIISWWLYLLWRKTRESAFFWLMFGIGVLPLIQAIMSHALDFFPALSQQQYITNRTRLEFLVLADQCLTIICITVGLWQLGRHKECDLLAAHDPDCAGEGV